MVGGGLTTDVTGFACSAYRRGTNYIRVPTTLIGLIDASVAIKVAVNHGHLKNRLGAYHPSRTVILDFSFLGHAADRTGAQRDGGTGQDRGGRQPSRVRSARGARRGAAAHPLRLPGRIGRAAPDRTRAHARSDPRDARVRGAQPARARSRSRDRLRPHVEPDARARPRATDAPRSRGQRRHGAVGDARRSGGATSRSPTATGSWG